MREGQSAWVPLTTRSSTAIFHQPLNEALTASVQLVMSYYSAYQFDPPAFELAQRADGDVLETSPIPSTKILGVPHGAAGAAYWAQSGNNVTTTGASMSRMDTQTDTSSNVGWFKYAACRHSTRHWPSLTLTFILPSTICRSFSTGQKAGFILSLVGAVLLLISASIRLCLYRRGTSVQSTKYGVVGGAPLIPREMVENAPAPLYSNEGTPLYSSTQIETPYSSLDPPYRSF